LYAVQRKATRQRHHDRIEPRWFSICHTYRIDLNRLAHQNNSNLESIIPSPTVNCLFYQPLQLMRIQYHRWWHDTITEVTENVCQDINYGSTEQL